MKIKVKVNKTKNEESKIKAFASLTFDDCFAVTGIKIVEGQKGIFVAMPSEKSKDEKYQDVCFPTTKEFREELINLILDEYKKL